MSKNPSPKQARAIADFDLDAPVRVTRLGTALVAVDGERFVVDNDGTMVPLHGRLLSQRSHVARVREEQDRADTRDRGRWTRALNAATRELAELNAFAN